MHRPVCARNPSGDRECRGLPAALAEAMSPWVVSGSPVHIWAKQKCHWCWMASAGHKGHQCWERGHRTVPPQPSGRGVLRGCHGAGWLLHPCGMGGLMPLATEGSLGYCPAHPSTSFCRRSRTRGLSNCLIVHSREKLSLSTGAPVQPVACMASRQPHVSCTLAGSVHGQHIPPVSHWRLEHIGIILNEELFNGEAVMASGQGAHWWHGVAVGLRGAGECLLLPLGIHISQLVSCGLAVVVPLWWQQRHLASWAGAERRGLSRGGPAAEPQPWGAVGFHGFSVLALPGHSLASPRSGAHGGLQPCPCPLCLPTAAPGGCRFCVFYPPVPLSPPSWCHSPSTASTRPGAGVGRRKGSLFPLC